MTVMQAEEEVRCPNCNCKHGKGRLIQFEFKCRRCKILFEVLERNGRLDYRLLPKPTAQANQN